MQLRSYAGRGICNDEIFSRFVSNFDQFKQNDFIVYQFTFPSRKGFVENDTYRSSAGFFNDVDTFRNSMKADDTNNQKLLDYLLGNSYYSKSFIYHSVQRVMSLLNYLQNKLQITYRVLFICNEYTDLVNKMNGPQYELQSSTDYDISDRLFSYYKDKIIYMNDKNIGIVDYIRNNKMTVTGADLHPNLDGHNFIFNKLVKSVS